ncbi:unnamed protein product [Fusarium venenatum]|uniref:Uncharacterized protein n=1 Tax=Fusarium venenatum TaxID=56646 RepID=A0A2L2TJM6_9HYPO|nr:uncharacterized protein FVRRES_01149 [Fusarium venenatum]CEI64637.1 unnamed protein product [Fusarium venenatum]
MNINYVYKSIPALRDHFFLSQVSPCHMLTLCLTYPSTANLRLTWYSHEPRETTTAPVTTVPASPTQTPTTNPTLLRDGSYYYSNPNGSTYHNNGQGGSTYTAPSGDSYSSGSGKNMSPLEWVALIRNQAC